MMEPPTFFRDHGYFLAVLVLSVLASSAFVVTQDLSTKALFKKSDGPKQNGGMAVTLNDDASYSVSIDGVPWFQSSEPFIRALGKTFSVSNGTLALATSAPFPSFDGVDDLGEYSSTTFTFVTVGAEFSGSEDGELRVECSISVYEGDLGEGLVFSLTLPDGAPDCGDPEDTDGVVTSFPGFQVGWNSENLELGFLSTGGHMLGSSNTDLALWAPGTFKIHGGASGGILAVFDKSNENAVVMTPLDNFMMTNMFRDYSTNEAISFGVMGAVTAVPAGFTTRTVLVRSSSGGIRGSIDLWGKMLRTHHGSIDVDHTDSDLSVSHLGYYTDNGAYYYYRTEENMTYEETVEAIVDHYKEIEVPIRYFQIDSWWYYKGVLDGVKNWTERPDIFPSGLKALQERIDMPIVAHNRYFAPDTVYAKENGGEYDFVVEAEKALPKSRAFWDDLMTDAAEWGMIVYEQDWLDRTYLDMSATGTDLFLATDWLAQMHSAAEERGLNIQYCMALTRFGLESVKHPRVTQIRVSEDYAAALMNWKIGISSMISAALGKAPFKDTFRSDLPAVKEFCSTNFEGVEEEICTREVHPALHSAVSTLSAGPVAPGDKIGSENVTLLKKTCRSDGKLLKPDRPAMAINGQMIRAAFGDSDPSIGPKGQVWTTTTSYSAQGLTFGMIFVADLKESFDLALDESGADVDPSGGLTFIYRLSDHEEFSAFTTLSSGERLTLESTSIANFSYIWYTSPVLSLATPGVEVAILGEMDKWVPMSKQRTVDIRGTPGELGIYLEGAEGETIEYTIAERLQDSPAFDLVKIQCTFGPAGEAFLRYPSGTCG